MASSTTVRRTFLFTDIESSTHLWDQYPQAMPSALERHDDLMRDAIARAGGNVTSHTGDGFIAVFPSAGAALEAALAGQRALAAAEFPGLGDGDGIKVRMGVHTGDVVERGGEYLGWALNVASRLHSLAHGGQIVVSGAAQPDAERGMAEGIDLLDLGMHHLRYVAEPIRVYTVLAEGLPGRFDDLQAAARPVPGIPRSLTSFVGRADEIVRVDEQLHTHRLVTLVGLAGVGKTRLAVEVASESAHRFADGVVMCELSGVLPEQVGAVLGKALGVERRTLHSAEESVVEWLHDKELLIILDNCEEAPDAVGELAVAVSQHAPRCNVLATSRQPLGVPGERVSHVQPLRADAETDDSVVLFFERALAAGADLVDDAPTRALVRDLCHEVSGVPLAIEIAASNASSLSLRDILEAVRAGELPRSSRASGGYRSIDDALDLTFDRLEPSLREAFVRCSVLPAAFDRAAFAAVVAPEVDNARVLELVRGLVDRSLLTSETRRERTRFRLLEPVRAYAEARLDPSARDSVQAAFVQHYVAVAEGAADALRGPDEARYVSEIELDFDNLRAAQARAISMGDADAALGIVAALWDYAFMRMRSEIFDWGEAACRAAPADHPGRSTVLGIVALGGWIRENPGKAAELAAESLRLEREQGTPRSLPVRLALLNAAEYGGDPTDTRGIMTEVIELSSESASAYWQTNVDVVRSLGQSFAGRSAPALDLANRALARARESENPSTIAWALFGRAVATEPVDVEYAEALLDDALARARSVENHWVEALCTTRLASVRRRHGSLRDAMTMVLELLDTWERAGHRSHLWSALLQAALCLADAGDSETAVMLNQAASGAQLAQPLLPADTEDLETVLAVIGRTAGEDRARLWASRAVGVDQAEAIRVARERLQLAIAG